MTRRTRRLLLTAMAAIPVCALTPAPAGFADAAHIGCRLADSRIGEASSLVDLGSVVVTANDSGDSARIFVVDPEDCRTVGVTSYGGTAVDVESMAPAGAHAVWVGDTGDNRAQRESISVVRVPARRGDRTVAGARYLLRYPDGAHDAESLANVHGRLVVITKGITGGVYLAPRRLSAAHSNRLQRIGSVGVVFATDAAASADGRWLLVRGYFGATLYAYPSLRAKATFRLPAQRQGEGISIGPGGRVLIDSEGVHSRLRQVRVPRAVARALTPAPAVPTASAAPAKAEQSAARPDDGGAGWLPWVGGGAVVVLAGCIVALVRRRRVRA